MSQEKRLRKYDEGIRRMQQKRRNEKEKALDSIINIQLGCREHQDGQENGR